jgi:hypothetical protein
MFQSNSRIEKFKGIRFYEQDVLFDDYVFTNDIVVTLGVDYMTPGIGIALINHEGLSIQEKDEAYLFRLGYKEVSIIHSTGGVQKRLLHTSVNIAPYKENMKFIFTKKGRRVNVSVEGHGTIFEYMLGKSIDKYNLGIYSNAGNIVKSIAVASSVPEDWMVNMNNTNGGYIKFFNNGFSIENCIDNAELEQYMVQLKAGKYFFKSDRADVKGKNDIQSLVFLSNDDRIYDEEKNLLNNNTFELVEDAFVNIKFKGCNGSISNIHITDNLNNRYVPTKSNQTTINGSQIDFILDNIKEIKWTAIIHDVPDLLDPYAIIENQDESFKLGAVGLLLNTEYKYIFDTTTSVLTVKKGNTEVANVSLTITNNLTIFRNINAIISQLTLIQDDNSEINLITERGSIRYIPASITSPIIVMDDQGSPMDLSSSYRVVDKGGIDKYIFTNVEREYFEPESKLTMTNKIINTTGSVKVYGIHNDAIIDMENILRIPQEGMDNIDLFCDKYDIFHESDLTYLDKVAGVIYIENYNDYKMFVVDYTKKDSYSINFKSDLKMYEIDMSTEKSNVSILYDHNDSGDQVVNMTDYKITDITPEDNSYIVLRREDF